MAEVIIVFRRQIEYHIYNSIAQALMLILVGYLSYHFDLDDFPDRIMVTLTTMLVIATMTSSIQKVRWLHMFFGQFHKHLAVKITLLLGPAQDGQL